MGLDPADLPGARSPVLTTVLISPESSLELLSAAQRVASDPDFSSFAVIF